MLSNPNLKPGSPQVDSECADFHGPQVDLTYVSGVWRGMHQRQWGRCDTHNSECAEKLLDQYLKWDKNYMYTVTLKKDKSCIYILSVRKSEKYVWNCLLVKKQGQGREIKSTSTHLNTETTLKGNWNPGTGEGCLLDPSQLLNNVSYARAFLNERKDSSDQEL